MKKIILSVAAATMAFSTSAMAIDNVKANGIAKLIYQTHDTSTKDFGDQMTKDGTAANSQAQAGVSLGLTADLSKNLSAGVEFSGVSTLGLENSLVGDTMATGTILPGTNTDGANTDDQLWMSQAYFSYNMGKTVAKIGLQELNTPLAFTEKWNVAKNTFQAIVLVNNDIENVTLVGAYVGKHNGASDQKTVNYDGEFQSFGGSGAYAAGAMAKVQDVNLQAWYYNVNEVADAYWLEADTKVAGIFIGGQFAGYDSKNVTGAKDTNAYAVKVGGDLMGAHLYAAYSSVEDGNGNTNYANVSTGDKTKLYTGTASIYGDGGRAAQEDTKGWKVGAKSKVAGIALGAAYSNYDKGTNGNTGTATDYDVIDFFAATKVGPVGLKAIYTDYEVDPKGSASTTTKTIRIIASAKF